MFVFRKTAKERWITVGVVLSFCGFLYYAGISAWSGGFNFILCVMFLLIPIGVYMGVKLAYVVARLFCLFLCLVSPGFLIEGSVTTHPPGWYVPMMLDFWVTLVSAIFCFYCLGAHAKLRWPKKEQSNKKL